MNPDEYGPFRVIPVGSCHVSLELNSQWRNRDHWHTLWPEGGHWCYPTEADATERADECTEIRAATRTCLCEHTESDHKDHRGDWTSCACGCLGFTRPRNVHSRGGA